MDESGAPTIAERAAIPLARCLGPHTARVAVKTFAQRALGLSAEALTVADVPALAQALKPMLRTLLGKQRGEVVAQQIMREFGL
jgi:non-ribosomal peptide synthetase component F